MDAITAWHWGILALLLIGAEIILPGVFLLWIGLAAGVTALLVWAMPELSWQVQLTAFAAQSIVAILVARIWFKADDTPTDQPLLNRRGEQFIGHRYTLTRAIENGSGQISAGDTLWKVSGPDLEEGCKVEVVGVDGMVLEVVEAERS